MKNWTIRARILITFAVILGLMMATGGVSFVRLTQVEKETSSLQTDSLPGLYYSARLMDVFKASYALTARHVLTADAAEKASIAEAITRNRLELDQSLKDYAMTILTDEDRRNFQALTSHLPLYFESQDEALAASSKNDQNAVLAVFRGRIDPQRERGNALIRAIQDYNKTSADLLAKKIEGVSSASKVEIAISGLVALAFACACGYALLRAVTGPLHYLGEAAEVMGKGDFSKPIQLERGDEFGALAQNFDRMREALATLIGKVQTSGIHITTSVTEIAATSKELQATANETAGTAAEIGTTSREISSSSRELARTMGNLATLAAQSASLAGAGQAGLLQMEDTMRRVIAATASINSRLAVLNDKAANISQVVTTITRVADQTNLLSLNAAIEAEKAGEYGRGFGVVAVEIRRLADQTAVATGDIEQMVKEIQSAVSAGVMGMDKFSEEVRAGTNEVQTVGAQLTQVIQQVQAMAPPIEAANEGMQAQASSAEQITQALMRLNEAVQQSAQSLRQSTETIDSLQQVANLLRAAISRFKLEG